MDECGYWRRLFHTAKDAGEDWKNRFEVAAVIAGFSLLCNLWQYCR